MAVIRFHETPISPLQINLPQVKAIDMEYYKSIEAKKYAISMISPASLAFRRAKREFYFQLIYHNNAIEGIVIFGSKFSSNYLRSRRDYI